LLDAIRMIDIGHAQADSFTGSWAGAFGNMQFMPTTFMLYAVDADSDGRVDVVNSLPDAFASAANYLSQVGWHANEPAMLEVSLPDNFDWKDAQFAVKKPLTEWSHLGVRAMHVDVSAPGFASKAESRENLRGKYDKARLNEKKQRSALHKPFRREQQNAVHATVTTVGLDMLGLDVKRPAAILLPQGYRGPAFMVFDNFDAIMDWNRSVNYALSVAQLAEQLRHESRIVGGQAAESGSLSFDEMLDLQGILNARGFDAGEPDGLPGFKTQQAVREYQLVNQLPADGYASRSVYQKLYSEQLQ
jgi:membrane-bound lytic murein transglycosylase B